MIRINLGPSIRKSVVPLYRIFSMVSLYGILLGILGYAVLFAFFIGATSWVAPFTVNPSDTQVLAITEQVVSSQTTITSLQLDYDASKENLRFSIDQLKGLEGLNRSINKKLTRQTAEWADASKDLVQYDVEAQKNVQDLSEDVNRNSKLRLAIDEDLAKGLITQNDALLAYTYIDSLAITSTTSKIAESDLLDSIRQHKMQDLTSITVQGQQTALSFQIAQLYSAMKVDEQRMSADLLGIATIQQAVKTATDSPFYEAVQSNSNIQLGVVPYDPKQTVKAGAPVYDCYLTIAVCHQVGTVQTTYPNELIFENPLSKTNTRGYVIKLRITGAAMRSKVLLVGRKPLLF